MQRIWTVLCDKIFFFRQDLLKLGILTSQKELVTKHGVTTTYFMLKCLYTQNKLYRENRDTSEKYQNPVSLGALLSPVTYFRNVCFSRKI